MWKFGHFHVCWRLKPVSVYYMCLYFHVFLGWTAFFGKNKRLCNCLYHFVGWVLGNNYYYHCNSFTNSADILSWQMSILICWSLRHQCRSTYSRGNIIIRHFSKCNVDVKCQLFRSFCTSFYCSSLWSSYNIRTLQHLKVAYNRIFRILMGLQHRTSMSENFIKRSLDPFKVIVRKLTCSFRSRILHSDNLLLKTIVDSLYFTFSKLTRKWNTAVLNLK